MDPTTPPQVLKTPRRSRFGGWIGLVVAVALGWGVATLLRDRAADEFGPAIAAAAADGDLFMFSATWCSVCTRAHRYFASHQVRYQSCEIDLDADCRARFERLGGQGTPLMVVRGRPQTGFSAARIAAALN